MSENKRVKFPKFELGWNATINMQDIRDFFSGKRTEFPGYRVWTKEEIEEFNINNNIEDFYEK